MSHTRRRPRTSSLSIIGCAVLAGCCLFYQATDSAAQAKDFLVFGSDLTRGFDMGVDSSRQKRDWVTKVDDHMKMAYPAGQDWGAVFITVGKPKEPPRPAKDFSAYEVLTIEMKGESGGEQLEVGVKTNSQPDDGSEVKLPVTVTTQWQTYSFPLRQFKVDLKRLYVVTEFVFSGEKSQTVYFRNIKYAGGAGAADKTNQQAPAGGDHVEGATNTSPEGDKHPPANNATAHSTPAPQVTPLLGATTSTIASWVFGGLLLLVLIAVLFSKPTLSTDQRAILRLLMALATGFFAVFFVGGVLLNGTLVGIALSATGGFVLFILIQFVFDPFKVIHNLADSHPVKK